MTKYYFYSEDFAKRHNYQVGVINGKKYTECNTVNTSSYPDAVLVAIERSTITII